MTGSGILRYILENHPAARIRAGRHITEPVVRHERIEYVKGDLRSIDECRAMARGCDCAIMAAAHAGGAGFTKAFPWEHMKENLLMNLRMLEAFHLEKVKRVVFIGSAVLYQEFEGSIKEEELDFNREPHEAYYGFAWGMRFIEKLCAFLNKKYGMEIVITRAANIFGPYDKFNPQVSNFIPAIIRKAVDNMDPFEVWGSSDVTRDVIYVDDFAKAIVMLLDSDKIKFDIFNIGSGEKTSVGSIVEWALKYTGHKPSRVKYTQDKPTTIKFRALDCSKIKDAVGWRPQYIVEEGVKKTAEWWIKNKELWKK